MKNKNNKIEYLNSNFLSKKIKYYNLIFLIDSNLEEVKKLNKIINSMKIKTFINNKKINILFIDNKKSIDLKILKNIFKKYNVLGKTSFNSKVLINSKIIKKIKEIESWLMYNYTL